MFRHIRIGFGIALLLAKGVSAQVIPPQKISQTQGGLQGEIGPFWGDGGITGLGDLDGDGVTDIAVGCSSCMDTFEQDGAVWILFLNADGTVNHEQKISASEGMFGGTLPANSRFGRSVENLGDLDGDGVTDIAVGAFGDSDGGSNPGANDSPSVGAVWILFLNTDGTVKQEQKISAVHGNFTGDLDDLDGFGTSVSPLGDLDGDGVLDLAVGARGDDDGGQDRGAIWILFLNRDGTVRNHSKISAVQGGFDGDVQDGGQLGWSMATAMSIRTVYKTLPLGRGVINSTPDSSPRYGFCSCPPTVR
ncbi:MAG: VCBS repeat-containing protein [Rhodothermales bacterium]